MHHSLALTMRSYLLLLTSILGTGLAFSLQVDTVQVINPSPLNHRATVVFLHGFRGNSIGELSVLQSFGFEVGPDVRLIAIQARETEQNQEPAWFPFKLNPWDGGFGDIAERSILQTSTALVIHHLSEEVDKLEGRWDRIFLVGLSQGGMMSSWLGLMSGKPFGGVVNFFGCFPLLNINTVVSAHVPVVHYHDPLDSIVPWRFAEGGHLAAALAGADMYEPPHEMTSLKDTHHGLARDAVKKVNAWIATRIEPSNTYVEVV